MQDNTSFMFPTDILVKILQHVPEQPRFSSCALVCRSWHTAAATATSSLTVQLPQQAQLETLELWLQQHGPALQALSISSDNYFHSLSNSLGLPIQQLQDLQSLSLQALEVDLVPKFASSSLGLYLSALTSLELDQVYLQTNDCIRLLTQLAGLRHLHLSSVSTRNSTSFENKAFQNWTQITTLVLGVLEFVHSILAELGGHTQLQQLQIRELKLTTATLSSLPVSLTRLELNMCGMELTLSGQLFLNLLELRHLDLRRCWCITAERFAATLLAALPQLKQLQHLSLQKSLRRPTDPEQYTALVSSSQLTYLELTGCCMPNNAVYHIFAAERQHPALRTFQIGKWSNRYNKLQRTICGGAIDRLVRRCPNLAVLHLADTIDPTLVDQMTVLQQLSTLSKLSLTGAWVSDKNIAMLVKLVLPALRDLEIGLVHLAAGSDSDPDSHSDSDSDPELDLDLHSLSDWTPRGLLRLCDMTQLTRLHLSCVHKSGEGKGDWCMEFVNQAGLPDLWEQMYHAFKNNGNFAKVLLWEQQKECAAPVSKG